jgi:hypothetical protein
VIDQFEGDRANAIIDRLSERYTGRPYPERGFTVYVVELTFEHYEELGPLPE